MGEVISLDQRRRARVADRDGRRPGAHRTAAARPATTFWFDLSSPGTYLAAERAERMFPNLSWRPVLMPSELVDATRIGDLSARAASARATELRMPLVWPDGPATTGRPAMRVASFAAERTQASAFVLAASRLAYCGGFDLDDPAVLAEAAAAAALPLDECLDAADDRSRDTAMEAAGRELVAQGADLLPVLEVGDRLFCGEERLPQAAAAGREARR